MCFNEPFQACFCFRSHSKFRVLTASGQQKDVACGDTVYVVDHTPYHVLRVLPSTSTLIIHPAFDSRCSSFVGFLALWAPPKLMTTLAINTDPIVECNLSSPVLQDAMDISPSTSPPIDHTIGCKTDSVEMKEFAALIREADEIEKLEAQVKEKEDELSRLRKSLNLLRNS